MCCFWTCLCTSAYFICDQCLWHHQIVFVSAEYVLCYSITSYAEKLKVYIPVIFALGTASVYLCNFLCTCVISSIPREVIRNTDVIKTDVIRLEDKGCVTKTFGRVAVVAHQLFCHMSRYTTTFLISHSNEKTVEKHTHKHYKQSFWE